MVDSATEFIQNTGYGIRNRESARSTKANMNCLDERLLAISICTGFTQKPYRFGKQ